MCSVACRFCFRLAKFRLLLHLCALSYYYDNNLTTNISLPLTINIKTVFCVWPNYAEIVSCAAFAKCQNHHLTIRFPGFIFLYTCLFTEICVSTLQFIKYCIQQWHIDGILFSFLRYFRRNLIRLLRKRVIATKIMAATRKVHWLHQLAQMVVVDQVDIHKLPAVLCQFARSHQLDRYTTRSTINYFIFVYFW